jgi:hypothetical protein
MTADALLVSGQATLAGLLRVRELSSFPNNFAGLQYQALTYGTRQGTFAGIATAPGPGGTGWDDSLEVTPSYGASALLLSLADRTGADDLVRPFRVYQNFPNPFRSSTVIQFDLPERTAITLRVYDVQGRLVRTLEDDAFDAGRHQVTWDGKDEAGRGAPAGIYFYRLRTDREASVRRIVKIE